MLGNCRSLLVRPQALYHLGDHHPGYQSFFAVQQRIQRTPMLRIGRAEILDPDGAVYDYHQSILLQPSALEPLDLSRLLLFEHLPEAVYELDLPS